MDISGSARMGAGSVDYDGHHFHGLTTWDGLAHDVVRQAIQDKNGVFWFATSNCVTRYIPTHRKVKPRVRLTQVIADDVYCTPGPIESTVNHVTFEYKGLSFKTQFERIRYIYKLDGWDKEWSPAAREERVRYEGLLPGAYLCSGESD